VTVNVDGHDPERVADELSTVDGVERAERIADSTVDGTAQFRLYTEYEPPVVLPQVLKATGAAGCEVSDLSIGTPSLEDVFIHLTGRDLR
jgi:ABC-2 type transport system ATP-binding protein